MEKTNANISPPTLQGEAAGFGTLPMNCLNHTGYNMSDKKDFYTKFVVELVPNNAYDSAWRIKNLKPVKPMQPRIGTRIYNSLFRNAINAPDRMNVLYSQDPLGRGKVSRLEELIVPNTNFTFAEARALRYDGLVRPRLVSFPLPDSSIENYLWIDLSWPIRNILLPISQVSYPGEKPNCTYVQVNFRSLQGRLPTGGWRESNNQVFTPWVGDNKKGLNWTSSAATMRIDLQLLYLLLTLPRHLRKPDYNVLVAFQLHRWDVGIPYDWRLPLNSNGHYVSDTGKYVSNYKLVNGKVQRYSTIGVEFDKFLSHINGVQVVFPPPPKNAMVSILNTLLSTALGFVPVIGPLLSIGSSLAIKALEDPSSMDVKKLLTAEFGIELAGAIIGSANSYQGLKNPAAKLRSPDAAPEMAKPLFYGMSRENYVLNPNIMDPTEEEKEMAKKDPKEVDPEDDSTLLEPKEVDPEDDSTLLTSP